MFGLKKMEKKMSDIADKVDALAVTMGSMDTSLKLLLAAKAVDLAPILDAIAAVSAKLEPTPPAAP